MAKTKRQKPDQFTNHAEYGNTISDSIHHAIKPLDRIANRYELKWGCDRLMSLVSPEIASKFGSAKAKLDQAIIDNDPNEVATSSGALPLKPNVWSHTTGDGFKFAVAQGNADAIKAIRTDPALEGVAVYSLDEIGHILESDSMKLVNQIKEVFPDSKVKAVNDDLNDELPF
jgi:hypothetical protein